MSLNSILYTKFCFIAALTSMGSVRLCVGLRWRRLCSILLGWGKRRWRTCLGIWDRSRVTEPVRIGCVWGRDGRRGFYKLEMWRWINPLSATPPCGYSHGPVPHPTQYVGLRVRKWCTTCILTVIVVTSCIFFIYCYYLFIYYLFILIN